ncbi:MAG: hypothetical protein BRD44_01775 [Bacteroidetes bacterium QS_7_67_15]|nr:MAG: hypothetical protein BRD44_01775 [Bacteroidetes bacterium QS_7_67_15]
MSDDRNHAPSDESGWLGRAASLGRAAVRLAADALDEGAKRAATTLADAEKAFHEGRDPNVAEAKILDEGDRKDGPDGSERRTADHGRQTS